MAVTDRDGRKARILRHLLEGLAALAAIATIVAVLFGDHLLDRPKEARQGEMTKLDPAPAPAVTITANEQSDSTSGNFSRGPDFKPASDSGVVAALSSVAPEEWCSTSAAVLLKRVLKAVDRSALERSADTGDARAQLLVGRGYIDGLFGFPKDTATAFSFFKRAASSGDPAAVNILGAAYDQGIGTEQDSHAAVRLYRRASDAGCVHAMSNLAYAYAAGEGGLPADRTEAIRLYTLAAKEGHEPSRQALIWFETH